MMRVGVLHGGLELEADKILAVPPSQRLQIVEAYSPDAIVHAPSSYGTTKSHFAATPALSASSSPLDSPVSSARSSPPPQTPPMLASPSRPAAVSGKSTDEIEVLKLDASERL